MKKTLVLLYVLSANICFASEEVGNISKSLKNSSPDMNYFSIFVSLLFVLFLIYVTGILYTKLNKLSIKTVKNELKSSSDIKPIILSTTPVGQDRTLQVVEIDGKKLLIGVCSHSINLIKELGHSQAVEPVREPIKPQAQQTEATPEEHKVNPEDFGLYKKYLR